MAFVCDKCGLCCRLVWKIPALSAFDRGDGTCVHLKNKLCDIYEQRPEICDVAKMYVHFKQQMSYTEYIDKVMQSCQYIKKHFSEMMMERSKTQK